MKMKIYIYEQIQLYRTCLVINHISEPDITNLDFIVAVKSEKYDRMYIKLSVE